MLLKGVINNFAEEKKEKDFLHRHLHRLVLGMEKIATPLGT